MKKQRSFNDFETLSTYNFVEGKTLNSPKKKEEKQKQDEQYNNYESNKKQGISPEFFIVAPKSLSELNSVILSLKKCEPVIVDLTYRKDTLTQKVLNYLNGAVFALDGSINKLMDNVYIILPHGASINTER